MRKLITLLTLLAFGAAQAQTTNVVLSNGHVLLSGGHPVLTTTGAGASVTVDNSGIGGPFNSGTTNTFSFTASASATLACLAWADANGGGALNPMTVTYNSVAMTEVPSAGVINGLFATDIWCLTNPGNTHGWGSSLTVSVTLSGVTGFWMPMMVSFLGANGTLGTAATNSSSSGVSAAVTPTGCTSGQLYLGVSSVYATGLTSGGSQTRLQAQLNVYTTVSSSEDTLPGSGSGAFTWTGTGTTSNGWTASAVCVE